eukprot:CAMPEP_0184080878 /NCGR_PEP_ID=MMETSP0974-20121125/2423_1 /TAXON_ID=483370 /ORGANISM="non described non described, Strain CCMP2097" /LENGTH=453 /DNA_ID=CAMNT_0026383547 /DNA_START=44 /DNA_END=1406 /DNA_ORIENTATION=-
MLLQVPAARRPMPAVSNAVRHVRARRRAQALLRLRRAGRQALRQVQIPPLLLQGVPARRLEGGRAQGAVQANGSRVPGPLKLKIKEVPSVVEDVAPASGLNAAARLSAVRLEKTAAVTASAQNDTVDWRGNCPICLDLLPVDGARPVISFYDCCCTRMCKKCSDECKKHDNRCPLCRSEICKTPAEKLRRLQKHVDKGNAQAQVEIAAEYYSGRSGLKQSFKRAFQLYELAAAQGHARAQNRLGFCYYQGDGVKINHKTAAQWFQRAADQGYPNAQGLLAQLFYHGKGVAQSYEEAAKWWRLSEAQGFTVDSYNHANCYLKCVDYDLHEVLRLYKCAAARGHAEAAEMIEIVEAELEAVQRYASECHYVGACFENGRGRPQDDEEALRLYKLAAAKGNADAAAAVERLAAKLAAARAAPPTDRRCRPSATPPAARRIMPADASKGMSTPRPRM